MRVLRFFQQRKVVVTREAGGPQVVHDDEDRDGSVARDDDGTRDPGLRVDAMVALFANKGKARQFKHAAQALLRNRRDARHAKGRTLERELHMFGGDERRGAPTGPMGVVGDESFFVKDILEGAHPLALFKEETNRLQESSACLVSRISTARDAELWTVAHEGFAFFEDERGKPNRVHGTDKYSLPTERNQMSEASSMRAQGCQSVRLRNRGQTPTLKGHAWGLTPWVLANGLEGDALTGVAKCHVEAGEDVLPAQEIKADAKPWRGPYVSNQSTRPDTDRQSMDIDRDRAAIAHDRISQLPSPEVKSQQSGFALGEDRDRSARVYIHPDFFPTTGTMHVQRDDGTWNPTKDAVPEGYRAHVKSSGRGTRRTEGITPGCFLCASVSSWTGSYPTNSSPSATTAYFPAYLSTSSSKCARIHAASSTRCCRILRLGITETSWLRSLA